MRAYEYDTFCVPSASIFVILIVDSQSNILMSESSDDCPKPLLTDFGLSHVLSPAAMTVQLITDDVNAKGTLPFMAKEMLSEDACREDFYTEASDVWAFGMTIYV